MRDSLRFYIRNHLDDNRFKKFSDEETQGGVEKFWEISAKYLQEIREKS